MVYKEASISDAERVANLHAASWQQNYRGSFSDHFLDNEVFADRLAVWQERLQQPKLNQHILIAEENGFLVGFICSYFNEHSVYGTYLDNLHVSDKVQGKGIGTKLMIKLAEEISKNDEDSGFYLWVLTTNILAISFYERLGGMAKETIESKDIGDTVFKKTRYVWQNTDEFLKLTGGKT